MAHVGSRYETQHSIAQWTGGLRWTNGPGGWEQICSSIVRPILLLVTCNHNTDSSTFRPFQFLIPFRPLSNPLWTIDITPLQAPAPLVHIIHIQLPFIFFIQPINSNILQLRDEWRGKRLVSSRHAYTYQNNCRFIEIKIIILIKVRFVGKHKIKQILWDVSHTYNQYYNDLQYRTLEVIWQFKLSFKQVIYEIFNLVCCPFYSYTFSKRFIKRFSEDWCDVCCFFQLSSNYSVLE